MRALMSKPKLTVNEEKTRICKVPDETFDFLRHAFGQMRSAKIGKAYIGHRPSRKSIKPAARFRVTSQFCSFTAAKHPNATTPFAAVQDGKAFT